MVVSRKIVDISIKIPKGPALKKEGGANEECVYFNLTNRKLNRLLKAKDVTDATKLRGLDRIKDLLSLMFLGQPSQVARALGIIFEHIKQVPADKTPHNALSRIYEIAEFTPIKNRKKFLESLSFHRYVPPEAVKLPKSPESKMNYELYILGERIEGAFFREMPECAKVFLTHGEKLKPAVVASFLGFLSPNEVKEQLEKLDDLGLHPQDSYFPFSYETIKQKFLSEPSNVDVCKAPFKAFDAAVNTISHTLYHDDAWSMGLTIQTFYDSGVECKDDFARSCPPSATDVVSEQDFLNLSDSEKIQLFLLKSVLEGVALTFIQPLILKIAHEDAIEGGKLTQLKLLHDEIANNYAFHSEFKAFTKQFFKSDEINEDFKKFAQLRLQDILKNLNELQTDILNYTDNKELILNKALFACGIKLSETETLTKQMLDKRIAQVENSLEKVQNNFNVTENVERLFDKMIK